jgi:hypothetical protein
MIPISPCRILSLSYPATHTIHDPRHLISQSHPSPSWQFLVDIATLSGLFSVLPGAMSWQFRIWLLLLCRSKSHYNLIRLPIINSLFIIVPTYPIYFRYPNPAQDLEGEKRVHLLPDSEQDSIGRSTYSYIHCESRLADAWFSFLLSLFFFLLLICPRCDCGLIRVPF